MSRHLRIGFWNLNGVNSSILGNQLKTDDFLSIINKHNIFALVETHATYETEMNISKFKHFIKCRNRSGNRSSRGNQKLAKGATYIPSENKNIIWCKPGSCVNLIKLTSTFKRIYTYMGRVKGSGEGGGREEKTPYFFSPPPPSPPFPPCTYPKGYYFYSPQSSSVIKSKMEDTTIRK